MTVKKTAYWQRIASGMCGIKGCTSRINAAAGEKICAKHYADAAKRSASTRAYKRRNGVCQWSGCAATEGLGSSGYCPACMRKRKDLYMAKAQERKLAKICIKSARHGPAAPGRDQCQKCLDRMKKRYHAIKNA